MKSLMAELLFDRPYDADDKSNRCKPSLMDKITATRNDPDVLRYVAGLREAFLQQTDCLCHGDFACDNILVSGGSFKVSESKI